MSQKILICDDDPFVHESLSLYLDREGFEHISAFNGAEGIEKFQTEHPTLIILDMMMPLKTGEEVCREIRKTSDVPIIMLTAKSEEIDRIIGLELGADDYISKPFSVREVVARVKAVLRRLKEGGSKGQVPSTPSHLLQVHDLVLNSENYSVTQKGKELSLTPKEFEILHLLASQPGQVIPREQIVQKVWGYALPVDSRTVDTHIKKIRQKLAYEGAPYSLIAVYGIGYKFVFND